MALTQFGHVCNGERINTPERAPFVFQKGRLEAGLVEYLCHEARQFEYEELKPARARRVVIQSGRDEWFQRDPWHDPKGACHYAYERFFHGLESPEVVRMQHEDMGQADHPPLPPRLQAFIVAVRRRNEGLLLKLRSQLFRMKGHPRLKQHAACLPEHAFACPAMQINWGRPRNRKSYDEWDDQWHVDSFKSFIHLSVTLQGSRTVWIKTATASGCNAEEKEVAHIMSTGSFYFTAPTAVKHNIEWPRADWKNRSICIQFRTQVPCQRFRPNDVRLQLARGVSSVLSKTRLVMPSLAEVLKIESAAKETWRDIVKRPAARIGPPVCVKATGEYKRKYEIPHKSKNRVSGQSGKKRKISIKFDNPKVAGSAAHSRYEAYKRARTVASFFRMGGTSGDLNNDTKMGFIRFV